MSVQLPEPSSTVAPPTKHQWPIVELRAVATKIGVGIASAATHAYRESGVPLIRNQNIKAGFLDDSDLLFVSTAFDSAYSSKRLRAGDLLTARTGYPGTTCIVPDRHEHSQSFTTLITRPDQRQIRSEFLCVYMNSDHGRRFFEQGQIGGAQKNVNAATLRGMPIPLPDVLEQATIATALSDVDGLIASLDRLIAKKRRIKQAAMQQLLTGKTRLPGFRSPWQMVRIAQVANEVKERGAVSAWPVVTCSKHLGFVDSLRFFKNQVFSNDTSGYKVVRRNQIAYPANHIEEGSIGLQDLHDFALVSPIYVVFQMHAGTSPLFLHRLLKLDQFVSVYRSATSASVDRRGSLRWHSFSQIQVSLPTDPSEQEAVTRVILDLEAGVAALQRCREKAESIRQGMMQALLTGRVRLPVDAVAAGGKA
jgi:type I restriction enzyme S subunit